MKCQHCGSTDIVMIQGQNYCLNCGYAVSAPAVVAAPPVASPVALPKASAKASKAPPSKSTPVSATPPASGATDIIPSTPSQRSHRRPSDTGASAPKRSTTSSLHPLRFSLGVALLVALVGGSVTAGCLWFRLDGDIGAYVIAATVITLGVIISLAHTALLYGRSRNQDGRPAPREYWWMAARSGFMDVTNVQLIGSICALLLVGVGIAVWQALIAGSVHLGNIVNVSILTLVNLALAWALLGVYTAARVATAAVVVGGLSAAEAVRVGWRLYLAAGGHLVAAAVEATLGRAIVAAILAAVGYAAVTQLGSRGAGMGAIAGGVGVGMVVLCAGMLTLEIDTKLWLAQYRHLATLCPPAERIRLLTGRVQSHKPA